MTNKLFKSIIDQDEAPVVICDINSVVVYMNESAINRYKMNLTGKNIKACHNKKSSEIIDRVLEWFRKSKDNNKVYTFRNDKENKDVYMIALRDENNELIGYYEKHEYRNRETDKLYNMD